jgi:hypothetical protein
MKKLSLMRSKMDNEAKSLLIIIIIIIIIVHTDFSKLAIFYQPKTYATLH